MRITLHHLTKLVGYFLSATHDHHRNFKMSITSPAVYFEPYRLKISRP